MKIDLKNIDPKDIAVVSGEFIRDYMPRANGDYIKVYLYLLYNARKELRLADIACDVELTENDVRHALNYWTRHDLIIIDSTDEAQAVKEDSIVNEEKSPVFLDHSEDIEDVTEEKDIYDTEESLESDDEFEEYLEDMSKAENHEDSEYEDEYESEYEDEYDTQSRSNHDYEEDLTEEYIAEEEPIEVTEEIDVIPQKKAIDSIKLGQDEEFGTLLYFIQMYIKKNLSQHDVERVAYMYESLEMSADLIEYMVESCVEKGKTSLRYMEKIAIDWYEKGIDTIEKAKKSANIYPKEVWEIMKAFGINSRLPGSGEVSYMNKWLQEYALSVDIIKEACDRTLLNAQKPSFHYADSILSRWYKLGIKSMDDIHLKDIKKDRIKTVGTQKTRQSVKSNNKFINFEQRDDNEDDLNNLINERLRQRLNQSKIRGSLDGVK